jgi:hypothetical protein
MKILFLAPHSAIWAHAFPEALVAESLQKSGHEIVYVTCGGSFSGLCIPMLAERLAWDSSVAAKAKVCGACNARRNIIRSSFGFRSYDLIAQISPDDKAFVDETVAQVKPGELLDFVHDGIEAGRYALYSLLIGRKKSSLSFTTSEWNEYVIHLTNTLTALLACQKIIDREKPDIVVTYNSLYSVNRVCMELARARGILTYFLHAGGNLSNRLQTMMIGQGDWFQFTRHLIAHWKKHSSDACTPAEMRAVTNHFAELFSGKSMFAYSSAVSKKAVDIRRYFGITENQQILLATMSSYDELFAAQMVRVMPDGESMVFPSQASWIEAVADYVATRPDLFLIVRVHPRELPNKREGKKSEHAEALEKVLANLPSNVRVNWPGDELSLYDVAEEASVILNAWSSAGKEMTLLGLPVVVYAPQLLLYPSDLNYVGTTVQEYFKRIEDALHKGWDAENIRKAYRWHVLELKTSLIDIGESYPAPEAKRLPGGPRRIFAALSRRIFPYNAERGDCTRRSRDLASADVIRRIFESRAESVLDIDVAPDRLEVTVSQETGHLRNEIARLIRVRYGETENRSKLKSRLIQFSMAN